MREQGITEPATAAASPKGKQRPSQYTFQELPTGEGAARFEEQQEVQIRKNLEMLSYLKQLEESMQQEAEEGGGFLPGILHQDFQSARTQNQRADAAQLNGLPPSGAAKGPRALLPRSLAPGQMSESSSQCVSGRVEQLPAPCMQCQHFERQLQSSRDFVTRLVSSYMGTARKLTGACLEGSMLLRLGAGCEAAPGGQPR
jgi:hypothetical protein